MSSRPVAAQHYNNTGHTQHPSTFSLLDGIYCYEQPTQSTTVLGKTKRKNLVRAFFLHSMTSSATLVSSTKWLAIRCRKEKVVPITFSKESDLIWLLMKWTSHSNNLKSQKKFIRYYTLKTETILLSCDSTT